MIARSMSGVLVTLCLTLYGFAAKVGAQESGAIVIASTGALKKLSVEELMDLEVTSVSKHSEKLSQAPSAIQVITGEDIRRSGASTLADALRLASNLSVAQKGAHAWGISARGFNTDLANKLLVLIDGRTVYTPLYSGVFWDQQDYLLEDIERIEVISGPGGALWGANAVNGVINIITRRAQDSQGLYLQADGGSTLRAATAARYGGALAPDVDFRVYGKYSDRTGEVFANGDTAADAWRMRQGGFRLDAGAAAKNQFTLQGDAYSSDEDQATGGASSTNGGNVLGRWTHVFSATSDTSLQMYYNRTHLAQPAPALVINSFVFAPAGTVQDDLDTYDVDFQNRLRLGAQHWVWGLGYRYTRDQLNNAPSLAFLPSRLNQSLYSGFVQDEIALRHDLSLTLGSKLEHNDYTGWEVEPSSRLQWNFAEKQMLWSAVSRAVRAPSRIDRDLSEGEPPYLVLLKGSDHFVSETLIAYELGYRLQFRSDLAVSVATFYNDYDNIRSTSFTPTTLLPFYFANNLQGRTRGVELSADYQIVEGWKLRGGYNLLNEHLRVKPGQIDLNNALNETADPSQQFSLHSSIDLPHHWEFDTGWRWVDRLQINNSGAPATVPSYFELDARLAWHPNAALEVSVVGQNLLHAYHPEYGIPGATQEAIIRGVYGGIAWHF